MKPTAKEEKTSIPPLRHLPPIFQQFEMIQAVYLFGSTVHGHRHAESDLDIAILPYRGAPRPPRLAILADLARHGFCRVDIVFLDTTDIVLKYEAVRGNYLLYQQPDFDHASFYSKIVRQYLDFL